MRLALAAYREQVREHELDWWYKTKYLLWLHSDRTQPIPPLPQIITGEPGPLDRAD